jgi:hypothetical protein
MRIIVEHSFPIIDAVEPCISMLFGLTGSDFSECDLADRCRANGWIPADSIYPLQPMIRAFFVTENLALIVDTHDEFPSPCCMMTLVAWDEADPDGPCRSRQDLVDTFVATREAFNQKLGVPASADVHRSGDAILNYAIWRGHNGVLILCEDDFDPQFGLQLMIWIVRWGDREVLPRIPLI